MREQGTQGVSDKGYVEEVVKNSDSHTTLPDIYEQYFLYIEQTGGISQVAEKRKALRSPHGYLEKHWPTSSATAFRSLSIITNWTPSGWRR